MTREPAPRITARVGPRALLALCLAALLFGPGAWVLASRVRDVVDLPLAPDAGRFAPRPVELSFSQDGATRRLARIPMDASSAGWLAATDEIHLLLATYLTSPRLESAALRSLDGRCLFATPPGAAIRNNETTAFARVGTCPRDAVASGFELEVRVGPAGRVALWTYAAPVNTEDVLWLAAEGRPQTRLAVRGRRLSQRSATGPRRADLVAYLWGPGRSAAWVWGMLGTGALLFFAACVLALARPRPLPAALAAALAAGSLALWWAILMPPLQGADEPDHLLSYATLVKRPELAAGLPALARRVHLERIRFHGDERFLPANREAPYALAWSAEVRAEDTARRSVTTAALWRLLDRAIAIDGAEPPDALLRLRLANAGVFAASIGLAALLLATLGRGTRDAWCLGALALMPALVPFATMVSEWAVLVSLGVVLAGGVATLALDGRRASLAGWVLGVAGALLLASGMAALPVLALLAVVLAARVALGPPAGGRVAREALTCWSGLALGTALGWVLLADVYGQGYWRGDATYGTGRTLLESVNARLAVAAAHPVVLTAVPVLGAGAEVLFRWLRPPLATAATWMATVVAALAAAVPAATLLLSPFVPLPSLAVLEGRPAPGPARYAFETLSAAATGLRLTGFDHLTFTTLWSGFGWLETRVPPPVLASVSAAFVLGIVVLATRLIRRHEARRTGWLAVVVVGTALSVVACAVACVLLGRNVHGRYLLALVLPAVVTTGAGFTELADWPADGKTRRVLSAALVAGGTALQGLTLALVLVRYV